MKAYLWLAVFLSFIGVGWFASLWRLRIAHPFLSRGRAVRNEHPRRYPAAKPSPAMSWKPRAIPSCTQNSRADTRLRTGVTHWRTDWLRWPAG